MSVCLHLRNDTLPLETIGGWCYQLSCVIPHCDAVYRVDRGDLAAAKLDISTISQLLIRGKGPNVLLSVTV